MTLEELLQQKAELDKRIAEAKNTGRAKAIAEIRELMERYSLSPTDLTGVAKRSLKAGSGRSVAAKYKDSNGNSWSGRGLKPKWLTTALAEGKKIEDFAI